MNVKVNDKQKSDDRITESQTSDNRRLTKINSWRTDRLSLLTKFFADENLLLYSIWGQHFQQMRGSARCGWSLVILFMFSSSNIGIHVSFERFFFRSFVCLLPREYFRDTDLFPAIELVRYQCSRKSTSAEISNIFVGAEQRQKEFDHHKLKHRACTF